MDDPQDVAEVLGRLGPQRRVRAFGRGATDELRERLAADRRCLLQARLENGS
jgi:hypothetical protein